MLDTLTLSLKLSAPDNDDNRIDILTRALLHDLREFDVVDYFVLERPPIPDGAKGDLGAWLKVTFAPQNLRKFFIFLHDRICNTNIPIVIELEAPGKKLKLKAQKPEDILAIMKQAQIFIKE